MKSFGVDGQPALRLPVHIRPFWRLRWGPVPDSQKIKLKSRFLKRSLRTRIPKDDSITWSNWPPTTVGFLLALASWVSQPQEHAVCGVACRRLRFRRSCRELPRIEQTDRVRLQAVLRSRFLAVELATCDCPLITVAVTGSILGWSLPLSQSTSSHAVLLGMLLYGASGSSTKK